MIDIKKLDKRKTYIGIQIGCGAVARVIQRKSIELTNSDIKKSDVASHVFAMAFKNGQWLVYESHMRTRGVARFKFEDWVKNEQLDRNFVFEHPLDVFILDFYARFNPGYSMGAIGKIAFSHLSETQDDKDSAGMICSEYITMAIPKLKPCMLFDLPPWEILPLHLQLMGGV